jgi:hypothetical protein
MYDDSFDFINNASKNITQEVKNASKNPEGLKRKRLSENKEAKKCKYETSKEQELAAPKRGRKKKVIPVLKSEYIWEIDYKNNEFPEIRYPTLYAIPDHLRNEFVTNGKLIPPMIPDKKNEKYPLDPNRNLEGREKDHLQWMKKFWTPDYLNEVIEILVSQLVEEDDVITLSLIDWLCIGYSKVLNITYATKNDQEFNLYSSYRKNLNSFFRPYFDMYCRGPRIMLEYMDDECEINVRDPNSMEIEWDTKKQVGVRMIDGHKMVYLVTSVGQLMFYKWALSNRVIEYCRKHSKEIKQHFNESHQKASPQNGKRRKLTDNPDRSWFIKKASVEINYDFLDAPCVNDIRPNYIQPEIQEAEIKQEAEYDQDIEHNQELQDWISSSINPDVLINV